MRRPVIFFLSWRQLKFTTYVFIILVIVIFVYRIGWELARQVFYPLWPRVIVIDPGHGGIDGGANCPGFLEKEINLAIALKLRQELEQQGVKVIMTREDDKALQDEAKRYTSRHRQDLTSRIEIIENYRPDLFVSIHVNANPRRPQTSGPMVFYNRRIPAAAQLATLVQQKLNEAAVEEGGKPHQARPAEYYLLRHSSYPGLIIETGFMTNTRERELLKQEAYQKRLAEQIAAGIYAYFLQQDIPVPEPTATKTTLAADGPGLQVYFPTADGEKLVAVSLPGEVKTWAQPHNSKELVRLLVEQLLAGPPQQGLEPVFVLDTRLLGVEIDNGIAVLNFSTAAVPTAGGSCQEQLALWALTETVCSIPGINGVKVLINGQERETFGKHLDLTRVLTPIKPKLKVAIVIDDLAGSNRGLEEMLALRRPLTLAIMPKLELTRPTAEKVHRLGYQVFLHLPMEPEKGKKSWLGPGAVTADMTPAQVRQTVLEDLADVPYASGMNNHMGSKITRRKDLMYEVLRVAKEKNLIYLDSRTTEDTVVPVLARELNMTVLERSVFLDDINSVTAIKKQIRELARVCRQNGEAIAIGHVGVTGPNLAKALREMVPWLEEQGIELVYVADLWSERSRR
ncbi:N-acetylmuramoyl-L-alanine amidase CwlD [Carboxydocella sporoproducens DSM 16521]|uniref:N-acetylmuramoyl-L-alanine amidase CwlD n=2 Tax=Carboxydocella TaxID=178898 RepID=A0A1T4PT68_9FIRM|nr:MULTISPECIES: divergent polysaccharide deacetylase family protein [Carboxydocella]AVX19653.1 N-acetylmuramoyl-L-alanine amidase CwlD [Carboxydocella thermautotrophica]SJZ94733.1 N-acetylmuramoyl-L-alanine amidase CwlD [Carboxydocella sporoproducens DSM 16521]